MGRWIVWAKRLTYLVITTMLFVIFVFVPMNNANVPVVNAHSYTSPVADPEINTLLMDNRNETLFAGTDNGVFRSQDGGESWQPVNSGITNINVKSLVQNSQDGTLYVGTWGGGIFRSQNNAVSWQPVNIGLTETFIYSLALDNRDGTLYAGTWRDNVFRSRDDAESWQPASRGMGNTAILSLLLDDQHGVLFAGTSGGGIYRSEDGAESWQLSSDDFTDANLYSLVQNNLNGVLYAGASNGVFYSQDEGVNWKPISKETTVQSLMVDANDGTLYMGTLMGVFRSKGLGENWQVISNGMTNTDVKSFARDDRSGTLYAGTKGGVFRLQSGRENWQQSSGGMTNTIAFFNTLAVDKRDGTLYAGTLGGVFRSQDSGETWKATSIGLPTWFIHTLVIDNANGVLYAGTDVGVFRSQDDGESWQAVYNEREKITSLLMDSQNGVLYAGSESSIFRLRDGEENWENVSGVLDTSSVTTAIPLIIDSRDGTLYAGTYGGGVFLSQDGGESWQEASNGLTNTFIRSMAQNNLDGSLYTGTDNGVFRSQDGGESWQAVNIGMMNTKVVSIALDNHDGTLYAGTSRAVFRSQDSGKSWQPANRGMTNTIIRTLVFDEQKGIIYAGTEGGAFRSYDNGENWQTISSGVTDTIINTLELGNLDDTLYAGSRDFGIFRSHNDGRNWQSINGGLWLWNYSIETLLEDSQNGILYAGINSGGIFRSANGGESWESASNGLKGGIAPYTTVWTLVQDSQSRMLYAGTSSIGVYRSSDEAESWEAAGSGLEHPYVWSLLQDNQDKVLYAGTLGGLFRLTDEDENWDGVSDIEALWLMRKMHGYVLRLPGVSQLLWVVESENPLWNQFIKNSNISLLTTSFHSDENDKDIILDAWGATILNVDIPPDVNPQPLLWMATRAWITYILFPWVTRNLLWLAGALTLIAVLFLISQYLNTVRPLGVGVTPFLFARRRLADYADVKKLDSIWQGWQAHIQKELLRYGNVMPVDLLSVPGIFRRYAIARYHELHSSRQTIELSGSRLHLLAGDRLKRWHVAWGKAERELGRRAGMSEKCRQSADDLCNVLKETLGLHILQHRDFNSLRIYLVEASALHLNLPIRFPLIFLADPQPNDATIQELVDAVEVLKERGYFALVVPLEPSRRALDIPAELHRAVERSPHAQDFIILTQEDILNFLAARQPQQALAIPISRQRNMTTLSPFVVNGPVPEQMFFGRKGEVRTLVEGAVNLNHAIIGNRKIGKTSLLNRVATRLKSEEHLLPIRMDCQNLPDAASFYQAFQEAIGFEQPIHTAQDFTKVIRAVAAQGKTPLLLLLDEVDILMAAEKEQNELLISTWRALAQAGECRFIFCGSGGLARQISDPKSAFFNFPQTLSLGYLLASEVQLVLTQPMETLGIEMENAETFHEKVLSMTSGHPNLVQYLGRELVGIANLRQEKCINPDDLQTIQNTSAYARFYFETIWGAVNPLEKLVTLLAPPETFRVGDMQTLLEKEEVSFSEEELDQALELLTVYAILERKGREYSFVPQAFHAMLNETQEVERLIRAEKREHAKGRA